MKPNPIKAILGGVVGTVVLTMMTLKVAPMILGRPMDIPAMIAGMMGGPLALGWAAHILLGVAVFPLTYVFIVFRLLPGVPALRGALWGVALWVAVEVTVMPMAGNGFFSSTNGGPKAVLVALMGHVVYGALLGTIAGKAEPEPYPAH
jgi:hypothetical protein